MKAKDIRDLSADEISSRITELERERFNLRFRGAQEGGNRLRLRTIRRDVARLHTVLAEKARATEAAR